MYKTFLMTFAKAAYGQFLRELVKEKIDDPNSDWDEAVMEILDRVFDYGQERIG